MTVMNSEQKAKVISVLLTQGVTSDHPLSSWVYILKKDGVPVISEAAGNKLKHRIIDTSLRPNEILARRRDGLAEALRWQRSQLPASWPSLIKTLSCPFARDEAAEYLRGMVKRQKIIDAMDDQKKREGGGR